MKITELLDVKSIALNVELASKEATIDYLVDLMAKSGKISDKKIYKEGVLAREQLTTTGIGEGIAIPHAQNKAVKKAGLAAITIKNGVDYDSLDNKPVYLCFMIAAPEDGGNIHLQALAKLSALLMNEEFRTKLINASSNQEFLEIIDQEELKKDQEETVIEKGYRVLAVTACPTGIAHTFMAAENLTKAGQKMGYPLKAETNGQDGAKNVLTAKEIEEADGIIIAADKNVEMARFDGKPVLTVSVTQGIQKPEELIEKVINHQVPIYHHDGQNDEIQNNESAGRSIYKHLMNGVSHM
uniref:fructose PTS transporter subunit IIA n=1 Tax=Thomasclavelia sp. TaxID=3025757 RepID=UPI0025D076DC